LQTQCVLGDLPSDRQVHYISLVEALEERFAPPNQMDLYRVQLKETPFVCAVIISQLYTSVVTFYFLVVLLDIIIECYFSSLWHTTGLHNWGHDIIIISHFGKQRRRVYFGNKRRRTEAQGQRLRK
jgi:hypothetical protein